MTGYNVGPSKIVSGNNVDFSKINTTIGDVLKGKRFLNRDGEEKVGVIGTWSGDFLETAPSSIDITIGRSVTDRYIAKGQYLDKNIKISKTPNGKLMTPTFAENKMTYGVGSSGYLSAGTNVMENVGRIYTSDWSVGTNGSLTKLIRPGFIPQGAALFQCENYDDTWTYNVLAMMKTVSSADTAVVYYRSDNGRYYYRYLSDSWAEIIFFDDGPVGFYADQTEEGDSGFPHGDYKIIIW